MTQFLYFENGFAARWASHTFLKAAGISRVFVDNNRLIFDRIGFKIHSIGPRKSVSN